jgi:hypothetical protein
MSFLSHAGIYRSDVVHKTIITWGASRCSAPGPGKRTRREELRALLIVRDEFPGWLFLGGLPSSRARLRFSNRLQYALGITAGNESSANRNLSLIFASQRRSSLQFELRHLVLVPSGHNPLAQFLS